MSRAGDNMSNLKKSFVFAALAILSWATIPTAFKIALAEAPVLNILTIASGTAVGVLIIIILITGRVDELLKTSARNFMMSALLGLVNPFIYYLILLRAYQLLPAQVAQPLNMIWPIVLVFLSVPLLKQKIPAGSFISLFISFTGVYVISSQGELFNPGRSDTTGVMLALSSSIFWALYFILNVRDKRSQAVKLVINFMFATLYLIAAVIITGSWIPHPGTKAILASVYIGVFEMGLTFYLWLRAMELAPSNDKIGNLVYLTPFIALVFIHFIVKEPVYYTTPIGLILIIGGIVLQNLKKKIPA